MKGKTLSLISKGVAVLFAIIMFIWSKRAATEILLISGFIAEAFLTVDISMIKKAKAKEA